MGRVLSRSERTFSMFRLALVTALVAVALGWQNNWDARHYMYCRNGQHIRRLRSYHDNHREDRRWQADCGDIANVKADQSCVWSGYVNGWDEMLTYACPSGRVLTGMDSYHDNGREDRRFRFRCCALRRVSKSCPNGRFGSQCQHVCQCNGNKACNKVTGACPNNQCRPGKSGPACQLDDRCYYDKREEYQGFRAVTASGRKCQQWSADAPHKHSYHMRCDFADGRTQKDVKNFCRTAVWETSYEPWCFTSDSKKRWEYCGIRKCGCPYGYSGAGCQTKINAVPKRCFMTGWINSWDAYMNYGVPSGYVLTGFFSMHDNGREDRIWKAIICQMMD